MVDVDRSVRRVSGWLSKRVDRRSFLRRAATGLVATAVALSVRDIAKAAGPPPGPMMPPVFCSAPCGTLCSGCGGGPQCPDLCDQIWSWVTSCIGGTTCSFKIATCIDCDCLPGSGNPEFCACAGSCA